MPPHTVVNPPGGGGQGQAGGTPNFGNFHQMPQILPLFPRTQKPSISSKTQPTLKTIPGPVYKPYLFETDAHGNVIRRVEVHFQMKEQYIKQIIAASLFKGLEDENASIHVSIFTNACSNLMIPNVPLDTVKAMMFQFSLVDKRNL